MRETRDKMMPNSEFEKWLFEIGECDNRFVFLRENIYEEERADFYVYYEARMTPREALNEEYDEFE